MTLSESQLLKRRLLPVGLQSCRVLREDDCHYVDKMPLIRERVERGRHYFLSRPRRFGKSLLVDTLKSLFEGHQDLFQGLDIHDHCDWSAPIPGCESVAREPATNQRRSSAACSTN